MALCKPLRCCSRLNTITSKVSHSQLCALPNTLLQIICFVLQTMNLEHLEVGKKCTTLLASVRHSQLCTLPNKLLQIIRFMLQAVNLEHLEVGKKCTAPLASTIK